MITMKRIVLPKFVYVAFFEIGSTHPLHQSDAYGFFISFYSTTSSKNPYQSYKPEPPKTTPN
jgi:hypothetical protein